MGRKPRSVSVWLTKKEILLWTLKFNSDSTVAGTISDGDWIFNVTVARDLITVASVKTAGNDPTVDFAMPVATQERKYFINAIGASCTLAVSRSCARTAT